MSKPENLEAKRALWAFERAEEGNSKQRKDKKFNYSAAMQELPSMIRMNGLRAAMAYFYSKKGHHEFIFEQISKWFRATDEPTRMIHTKYADQPEKEKPYVFMKILLELTDDEYRIVEAETLTLANWMIRFVKTEDN